MSCACSYCTAPWNPSREFEALGKGFAELARALVDVEMLAYALFRADPEVKAFVAVRGEGRADADATITAWDRNEMGRADYWLHLAREALAFAPEISIGATHARARTEASADVVDGKAYRVAVDRAERAEDQVARLRAWLGLTTASLPEPRKPADPFDAEARALLRDFKDAQRKMTPRPVRVGGKVGVAGSDNTFHVAHIAVVNHARTHIRVKLQGYEHAGSIDGSQIRHVDGAPVDELASIALLGTPGPGDPPGYEGVQLEGAEGRIVFYTNPPQPVPPAVAAFDARNRRLQQLAEMVAAGIIDDATANDLARQV